MDYFLADDLSGALDAAAAFHRAGRRVRIVRSTEAWANEPGDDVVGVTTETRNVASDLAARAVTTALARGRALGGRLLYKKIDSTLRGPVAAELAGLAAALPDVEIVFTPANPRVGRTVVDGVLRVHGVPVAETEFARDPLWPVRESAIAKLLGDIAARVHVIDATTENDLAAAVERVVATGKPWVAVGSGALAQPVAARFAPAHPARTSSARPIGDGPILMIGGSAHADNRAQADVLARARGVRQHEVNAADLAPAVAAAIASLRERGSAALVLPTARMDSALALRTITAAAAQVIERASVGRVFATGGETAYALCDALGVASLNFEKEIEAGLSLSRGEARRGPLLLAVKPGGFGDAQTWVRAWTELRAAR